MRRALLAAAISFCVCSPAMGLFEEDLTGKEYGVLVTNRESSGPINRVEATRYISALYNKLINERGAVKSKVEDKLAKLRAKMNCELEGFCFELGSPGDDNTVLLDSAGMGPQTATPFSSARYRVFLSWYGGGSLHDTWPVLELDFHVFTVAGDPHKVFVVLFGMDDFHEGDLPKVDGMPTIDNECISRCG